MRYAIVVLTLAAATPAAQSLSPALKAIVETERAFARASVRHGQRDAFGAFLADDGVTFSPNPGRGPGGIRKRPSPPPTTVLNWAPMLGAASHSGDLGFTTGPYAVADTTGAKPTRHGIYLTVWRRHADGRYLVDLDVGIATPQAGPPLDQVAFMPLSDIGKRAPEEPRSSRPRMRTADGRYNNAVNGQGWVSAAAQFQLPDARLYIDGREPLTSRPDIEAWIGRQGAISFNTVGQRSSDDGDLAYTYGEFQQRDGTRRGWYVRIWTREPRTEWKVLIETFLPLPPR